MEGKKGGPWTLARCHPLDQAQAPLPGPRVSWSSLTFSPLPRNLNDD